MKLLYQTSIKIWSPKRDRRKQWDGCYLRRCFGLHTKVLDKFISQPTSFKTKKTTWRMGAGESVHAFDNFDKHLASRILRYGKYANVLQLCPPKWVSPPGQGAGTTTSVRGWRPGPCDSQGFRRPPREVDGALWLEKAMFFPIFSLEMSRKKDGSTFWSFAFRIFLGKKNVWKPRIGYV